MNVPSKPDDPAASDSDSIDHSKPENESEILSAVGMKWINYWESKIDANLAQLELALLNKLPKNSLDDENGVGGENDDKVEVAERHFNELKKECNEIYCKYLKLDVQNSRLEREMHQLRQQLRDTANRNRCLEQQLQQQKATSIAKDYSLRSLNSSFSLNSKSIGHPLPSPQPAACPIRFVEDEHEIRNLRHENRHIRRQLTEIRNDLFGAKLSAKYLDKELSGRIQQIQILSE